MSSFGSNQQITKERNRGLVLRLISTGHNVTRQELAKKTGLTRMTITNIVNELMEAHFVREGAEQKTDNVGRNPTVVTIAPDAPKIIGILILRNEISAILVDLKLRVLREYREGLHEETGESLIAKACNFIDMILAHEKHVMGIGIASIGQWDIGKGRLIKAVNFFDISNLPITEILAERYGLPVYVNNDMNAATIAEKLYGYGTRYHDFIYLGITNGIGGAIVTNDVLYQEEDGLAGEIGHMGVDPEGPLCACGNHGCLELYASVPRIEARLREATGLGYTFQQFCGGDIPQGGHQVFLDVLDKTVYALTSVTNLLNCEAVIIGHDGYFLPDRYIHYLEDGINAAKVMKEKKVNVLKTAFEQRTALYGSACCVISQMFDGRLWMR